MCHTCAFVHYTWHNIDSCQSRLTEYAVHTDHFKGFVTQPKSEHVLFLSYNDTIVKFSHICMQVNPCVSCGQEVWNDGWMKDGSAHFLCCVWFNEGNKATRSKLKHKQQSLLADNTAQPARCPQTHTHLSSMWPFIYVTQGALVKSRPAKCHSIIAYIQSNCIISSQLSIACVNAWLSDWLLHVWPNTHQRINEGTGRMCMMLCTRSAWGGSEQDTAAAISKDRFRHWLHMKSTIVP